LALARLSFQLPVGFYSADISDQGIQISRVTNTFTSTERFNLRFARFPRDRIEAIGLALTEKRSER